MNLNNLNLPNFIIIGAQKAATSTLRYNLNKHPDIFVVRDELHFFNNEQKWSQGVSWYSRFFDHPEMIQGEKTPNYLSSIKAHERIASTVPNAKLIILLRNPIDRAYSAWNYFNLNIENSRNWGWKIEDFETIITDAEVTKLGPFAKVINNGKYIHQIENLLKYFPREQLFFGITERFKQDPNSQFSNILDFIGVRQIPIIIEEYNVMPYLTEIKPDTRNNLDKLFAPFNQQLFEFLGEEIKEWKL